MKLYEAVEKFGSEEALESAVLAPITTGLSLLEVAKEMDIEYADLWSWIIENEKRLQKYNDSILQHELYLKRRILDELKYIAFSDIREVCAEDGSVKLPKDWSNKAAAAVKQLEFRPDGSLKIVKVDKLKANEMLGRELGMFKNEVKHSGSISLEELIATTMEDEKVINEEPEQSGDEN